MYESIEKVTEKVGLFDANNISKAEHRIIKESNNFYFVRHNMTMNQHRMVLLVASELQFKNLTEKDEIPYVTLYIPDIEKILGIVNGNMYRDLYSAGLGLGRCAFEKRISPGEYEVVNFIETVRVSKGRGLVQVKLTRSAIREYFGKLTESYHRFQLRLLALCSTSYQMNLYKALSSVQNTSHKTRIFYLYPEYIRDIGDLYFPDIMGYRIEQNKSYREYKNVKRKILIPALKGIEEKTDIVDINVQELKSSRKVYAIKISYRIDYSRRTSLHAASQSWMHPLEYGFSTDHYKKLGKDLQLKYDSKGFEIEEIRQAFNQYVIDHEETVREYTLKNDGYYPDVSTIDWYINWLFEKGILNGENAPEITGMIDPAQSITAIWYASKFQTAEEQLISADFELDDHLTMWAIKFYPYIDHDLQTTNFILHARENKIKSKNWVLRWMRWLAGSKMTI